MDLGKLIADFGKVLKRLEEAHVKAIEHKGSDYYEFFRDSSILRFEICVEIMWKTIKKFLEEKEGLTCRSPKGCIRELLSAGLISQGDALKLLQMIDHRNMTVHTYHEEMAEEIFKNIALYIDLMNKVVKLIER